MIEGFATVAVARRVRPDMAVICEPSSRRVVIGQRGRAESVIRDTKACGLANLPFDDCSTPPAGSPAASTPRPRRHLPLDDRPPERLRTLIPPRTVATTGASQPPP